MQNPRKWGFLSIIKLYENYFFIAFLTFALSEDNAEVSPAMGGGGGGVESTLVVVSELVLVDELLSEELLQAPMTVARAIIVRIFFIVICLKSKSEWHLRYQSSLSFGGRDRQ